MQQLIGADWLLYQDLEDLEESVRYKTGPQEFDTSCFSGKYVTGGVTEEYFARLRELRADNVKTNGIRKPA